MEYKGILVGLGNPGPKYVGTRHNLGFALVDYILDNVGAQVESMSGSKFKCELWRCRLFDDAPQISGWWLLAKPLTFMNLSGECVQPLLAWHKLKPANLVVLHDELDIKVGELRFKTGGGNAGHNGLKSINQHLGTPDFHRLRLGIGRPEHQMQDVSSWVLSTPCKEQAPLFEQAIRNSIKVLHSFYLDDTKTASKVALSLKPI